MISASEARRIGNSENSEETRVELKLRKALNNRSDCMKVIMSVQLAGQMT